MICSNCDREKPDLKRGADYLCSRCREVEDIILSQEFPQSDKLSELHNGEAGIAVQSFLSYLEAADMVICHANADEYSPEPVPWTRADKLMREWAGIDEDRLDVELDALYQTLKRANS